MIDRNIGFLQVMYVIPEPRSFHLSSDGIRVKELFEGAVYVQ
jgi:hypothetical protein